MKLCKSPAIAAMLVWMTAMAVEPATPAVIGPEGRARADALKAHIDGFRLSVWLADANGTEHLNVMLHVAGAAPDPLCPFCGARKSKHRFFSARIDAAQAGKVIDHLAAEGFLDRCTNVQGMPREPTGFPGLVLTAFGPGKTELLEELHRPGLMLLRLDRLREVLDGEAAEAMDKLLAAIGPQRRQWDKAGQEADRALRAAADKARAEHPAGGEPMWRALAGLLKTGMAVRQMKAVLPPAGPRPDGMPHEVAILDGAHFTISYPLDGAWGAQAYGTAVGRDQDWWVLSASPRIRPRKDLPAVTTQPAELPGRDLSDLPKLAVSQPVVMLCRAASTAHLEDLGGGLRATVQEYEPIEPLTVLRMAGKFTVAYLVRAGQRAVARDERVVWLLGSPVNGVFPGVNASADTPADRKAILAAAANAGGDRSPASLIRPEAVLLPGSRVPVAEALAKGTIVAACRATREDTAASREAGVLEHSHVFDVLEVISGPARPGKAMIYYTQFDLSVVSLGREKAIGEGEVVLWIAREGAQPGTWSGIKALRDTPGNRRLIQSQVLGGPASGGLVSRPAAAGTAPTERAGQPAPQEAADDDCRRLYEQYKARILPAARVGDANEVLRLTDRFNESVGGRLLYIRVTRIGPAGQMTTLANKPLGDRRIALPNIHYAFSTGPHITRHDDKGGAYVLVETNKLPGGGYADGVYITMALQPVPAGSRPSPPEAATPATRPAASAPAPHPSAAAGWQTHELAKRGDIAVTLAVKPRTGPADEEWLRLEFHNAGRQRVQIADASYYINRETFDLKTGRAVGSGNLASGNTYDLFPHAWRTTPVSPRFLEPGTYVVAEQPSSYSSALLGMPPPTGWRIKARVHFSMSLADGSTLQTPQGDVEVSFDWLCPDAAGIAAMQRRLKRLLAAPVNMPYHTYILGMLLEAPEVPKAVAVDDLLGALAARKGPFDGRESIAKHLSRHAAEDRAVIRFYRDALARGEWLAADDLYRWAPDVWDDGFTEPLVRMNEAAAGSPARHRPVLTVLDRHAARWKDDPTVAPRLLAAVRKHFAAVLVAPDEIKEDQLNSWRGAVEFVGMTRDPDAVKLLRPFLDSTRVVHTFEHDAIARPGGPPVRACDAAYNAIQTILGREDRRMPLLQRLLGMRADGDGKAELLERDRMVEALKAELAAGGAAPSTGAGKGAVPAPADRSRLRTAASPFKLLASGAEFEGEALPRPPDRPDGPKVTIDGVAYYRSVLAGGLIAEDPAAKTARVYRMFDLAVAAGWHQRKGNEYLPQDIRGLYRQGERLWMGSNGVGAIAYDAKAGTWARHDVKDGPIPGHHVTVFHADEEFAFISHGWHQRVPAAEPSLHVFSARCGRWLRIAAIPSGDALRLGCSDGLRVAMGWDYRPYAKQDYVPLGGQAAPGLASPNEIAPRGDGTYLLRYGHPDKESSLTELLIRAADLRAAFAAAAGEGAGPASAPAAVDGPPGGGTVTIAADYRAAVEKALPAPWEVGAGSALGTILLRDKTRPGRFHALLCIHAPGVMEHPGGDWGKGKTFRSILKAANGEVFLWAEPGDWQTMEADLAKAVVGEPLRIREFTVEFTDARGKPQEAVIFPDWHKLRGFGHTQESFEKACRAALTARPVEDVREVWVQTSTHRDMLLTNMARVGLRPGRPWPHPELSVERAVANAAAVLRATAISEAEVFDRSATHLSTASGRGEGAIHGGGTVHFAQCRQRFRITEALLGEALPEQRSLEYGFVEKSDCHPGPSAERALPEGAAAILILDQKGQLLTAIPDTDEARRQVRAALARPASRPATQPAFDELSRRALSEDRRIRGQAARDIRQAKDLRYVPTLFRMLELEDAWIRKAIKGLAPGAHVLTARMTDTDKADSVDFRIEAEAGPDAPETRPAPQGWGEAKGGLCCRLTAEKDEVPLGAKIVLDLHFRFDPNGVDPRINVLNRCDEAWRAALTFTDARTGKAFRRAPFDVGMPPVGPRVGDLTLMRGQPLRPDRLAVFLLSDKGEQVPPGTYRVTATYDNTAEPQVEAYANPDGSVATRPYKGPWTFWKGRIESGPLTLRVTDVLAEEVEIKTHSALAVRVEKDGAGERIGWTWSQKGPVVIRMKPRPGYVLGRKHEVHVFVGGKEVAYGGGGLGGVWRDGSGMSYLPAEIARRVLAGEPLRLVADVEVFETSAPPRHMWSPESGDYKVLWKGRVEGSLPAAGGEKEPILLPRDSTTVERVVADDKLAFAGVCEAAGEASSSPGPSGVYGAQQEFRLAQVLAGTGPADPAVRLSYSRIVFAERAIRKGERVIWIVWREGDLLVGVKALADTEENRRSVRAAAARPTTRPGA